MGLRGKVVMCFGSEGVRGKSPEGTRRLREEASTLPSVAFASRIKILEPENRKATPWASPTPTGALPRNPGVGTWLFLFLRYTVRNPDSLGITHCGRKLNLNFEVGGRS